MVFEAHERSFRFFRRGLPAGHLRQHEDGGDHGLSFVGKKRDYNRHFQEMCSHHLVEPVACTPGAGWEKGQVEKQVGDVRGRLFVPIPRGRSYAEINEWLMDRCIIERSARVAARRRQEASAPDDPGQDSVAGVPGGAPFPDGVPRSLRRLPCDRSVGVQDLPGALRQQPVQRGGPRGRAAGGRAGLCRIGSSSARMARPLPSIPAASDAARSSTSRGTTCRSCSASRAHCVTAHPSGTGSCPGRSGVCGPGWRPTTTATGSSVTVLTAVLEDGLDAVEEACAEALDCWCLQRRRRAQHPRPAAPAGAASGPSRRPRACSCVISPRPTASRYDSLRGAGHGAS